MRSSSQAVRLLARPSGIVVLAGLAGTGKTEMLAALATDGEQVLDLEALASHRGSAFGAIGLGRQPSHRAFVAAVRRALAQADPARVLWVEDEGPFIGRVGLPPELADRLARAPVVELRAPLEDRVARLVTTYGAAAAAELSAAIARSETRLGRATAAAATAAVAAGDLPQAARLLLPAYDAAYEHRMARLGRRVLGVVALERAHESRRGGRRFDARTIARAVRPGEDPITRS